MKEKIHYKFDTVISPETKYMHLMEAIEEVQLNFLLARLKGEKILEEIKEGRNLN